MRKNFFTLCTFLFFCSRIFSQPSVPVDPLTGSPQLSIPIWQLREGDLNAPVIVVYDGGGVKVEQPESSAGMSWSLHASGAIYRQVRGIPDDYIGTGSDGRKGWLAPSVAPAITNFNPSSDSNLSTCSDEISDYNFLSGLGQANDTEPDIFHFNAPGLSGKFVFGDDGFPRLIPYQDLKIDVTKATDGSINSVQIKNNNGVSYVFSIKETVKRTAYRIANPLSYFSTEFNYYSTPLSYTGAWYLSSMNSLAGNTINFYYTQLEEARSQNKFKVVNEAGTITHQYSIKDEIIAKQLSVITTSSIDIRFEWEGLRISRIKIQEKPYLNEKIYHFEYIYARDYRDSGPVSYRKAWLKRIRQESNCIAFPSYEFSYNGLTQVSGPEYTTVLPFKDENMQDLWGYYNGVSADKIPDIYYYSSASDAEKYRLTPIPGQTPTTIFPGSGRTTVNIISLEAGALASMQYPSGASAQITYEPNQYFDAVSNQSEYAGGLRVRQVLVMGGEKGSENIVYTYDYTHASGLSSGKLLYRPVFSFSDGNSIVRTLDNLAPEGGVLYARSTVKQTGHGKTVYEYHIPAMYPQTSDLDWLATQTLIARSGATQDPPCPSVGSLHTGYYTFPFAPNTNFDFERGLPARIATYSETGMLTGETLFSYQRISSGIQEIKGLVSEKMNNNFLFGLYRYKTNVDKVIMTETSRKADDLNPGNLIESSTTYQYSSAHQMLRSISTTNSDGAVHKTEFRYAKDFEILNPDPAKPEAVAIKLLNDFFSHGSVIETTRSRTENSQTKVTGASSTWYKDFGNFKVFPHKQFSLLNTSAFNPATVTTDPGGLQSVSFDTKYQLRNSMLSYSANGLPQSFSDFRKNTAGIHYDAGGLAVAKVFNATAEQTAYNGFERSSSQELKVVTGANATVQGWAGRHAYNMQTNTVLRKDDIQKGSNIYRCSFWLKSPNAAQLTFRVFSGTSTYAASTFSYGTGDVNKWKYFEGAMDITQASSTFSLEVTANAACNIDEIRFLPSNAAMETISYDPLNGETSATDDRGISAFTDYDELGRVKYLRNRNKDIMQVFEYRYKKEAVPKVRSSFTASKSSVDFKAGEQITFTSSENCLTGLTYQWKVDGSLAGTNANLSHTFQTPGQHAVELTVQHGTYGSSTSLVQYCIDLPPLLFSINIVDIAGISPAYKIFECDGNYQKKFTANYTSGGCGNNSFSYYWYYKPAGSQSWEELGLLPQTITLNLVIPGYQVRCIVTQENCLGDGNHCYYNNAIVTTEETIVYVEEQFCE